MPPPSLHFQIPITPTTQNPNPRPHPPIPSSPRPPLLRLQIRDLSSKGSLAFLALPEAGSILQNAVTAVLTWLYKPTSHIPPTRSITLILRDMPGVAYTTGSELDSDHKEIHFSTGYIESIAEGRLEEEVLGVVTHEMVHCWQWAARGTCPTGLIEGIADFVRLRAGFVPAHWRRESGGEWDSGYQHTGYFLDFLESKYGDGTVVRINQGLRVREYDEATFWDECCGCGVKELWEEYGKHLKREGGDGSEGKGEHDHDRETKKGERKRERDTNKDEEPEEDFDFIAEFVDGSKEQNSPPTESEKHVERIQIIHQNETQDTGGESQGHEKNIQARDARDERVANNEALKEDIKDEPFSADLTNPFLT